mgnify:CR=1 FL=1
MAVEEFSPSFEDLQAALLPERTLSERARASEPLSTEAIYQLLRQLAERSAPQRQGLAVQGLNEWTARANASPTALLRSLTPQIRQIREQLQQAFTGVSRRLGPAGGAQIRRGEQEALGGAGGALSRLLAGGTQAGTTGLVQFLRALRPALLTQLPQLVSQESPGDFTSTGHALAAATGLAGKLFPQRTTPLESPYAPLSSDVYLGNFQTGAPSAGFSATAPVFPEF